VLTNLSKRERDLVSADEDNKLADEENLDKSLE